MALNADAPKPANRAPLPDTAWKPRILGFLLGCVVRLLTKTLRVTIQDDSGLLSQPPEHGLIWMFWHNRMLIIPVLYTRYTKKWRNASVFTSASRDGAVLAAVMRRFGLSAVRGSSSRRGGQALVECRRRLRENYYIGITPDGPRGPIYQMQPGVVQLAKVCKVPVLPIRVEYSSFWRLKSWDKFMIPKPFSRVRVHFLPFVYAENDDLEADRLRFQELLKPETP